MSDELQVPQAPVAQFGVRMAASSMTYGYIDGHEHKLHSFRPRVGISFDDILEFTTMRAALFDEVEKDRQELVDAINALGDDDEAAKNAKVAELNVEYRKREKSRFAAQVEHLLFLVDERDQEAFAEVLLKHGHPDDVAELISYLRNRLINKTQTSVQAVANVDPTSPPSPAD